MIRTITTLFFLFIALTACQGPHFWRPLRPIVRDYDSDAFTSVTLHQAARLAHKYRWYLDDAWMYYNDEGTVHRIRLQYRTQNILELQEARALLVDVVEEFLDTLEDNNLTAMNLSEDFSSDNLEIYVDFQSYWGLYGDPEYIGWMVLQDGMVYYYDFNVKNRNVDFWYNRIESYEKSKEIVRIEREAEDDYIAGPPPPDDCSGLKKKEEVVKTTSFKEDIVKTTTFK